MKQKPKIIYLANVVIRPVI